MKRILILTAALTALAHVPDFLEMKAAYAQTHSSARAQTNQLNQKLKEKQNQKQRPIAQAQKIQIPTHGGNPNTERLSTEPTANTRVHKGAPSPQLKQALNTPVKTAQVAKPKLNKDQYSLDKDGKITVFSAKMFSDFKLSQHCFKNSKSRIPNCEAWTASHKKINEADIKLKTPEMNNKAAIYCDLIGGQNVIVKTYQNSESDFCLFNDGSLVSSWSAYDNRKLNK